MIGHRVHGLVCFGWVWCRIIAPIADDTRRLVGLWWCPFFFFLVWLGLVWFGLVWFSSVWIGLDWFGLVWFGLGRCGWFRHYR